MEKQAGAGFWFSSLWLLAVLGTALASCSPGSVPPARLGDRVWNDLDGDGLQDEGEAGKEGVEVALHQEDGTLVAADLSDEFGLFAFDQLRSGRYYLRFAVPEGWTITRMDAGDNDEIDSDADPLTGLTEVFNFDSNSPDLTRDLGVLAASQPTHTPVPSPTATATATSTPVPPSGSVTMQIPVRFVRTEGACGAFSEFEDTLHISIEDGMMTMGQPTTGDLNSGSIMPDGSFRVESEREAYEGTLHFQRAADGRMTRVILTAVNRYETVQGCVEMFELDGESEQVLFPTAEPAD